MEWFYESYEDRVKAVVCFQERFRTSILDGIARVATFCSDEEFYLITLTILYWGPICETKLAFNLCVCVGLGLPIGNILKNIYCVRRPSSPPVWHYATSNEEVEFASPSTHALLSSSVSLFTALHFLSNYDHHKSKLLLVVWIFVVLLWTVSISISRVYMGAHTFQDIVFGGTVGLFFGVLLSVALETFHETLIIGSPIISFLSLATVLLVLHAHPINKSTRLNFHLSEGTFDYTSPLLGLTLGGIICRNWFKSVELMCISTLNYELLFRFMIGTPFTIFSYILTKKLLPYFIEYFLKLLRIKAHYIPYTEFSKYVSIAIKYHTESNINKEKDDNNNGKIQNPEYLLAWTRIYTKFILYVVLTFNVSVVVPVLTDMWFKNQKFNFL